MVLNRGPFEKHNVNSEHQNALLKTCFLYVQLLGKGTARFEVQGVACAIIWPFRAENPTWSRKENRNAAQSVSRNYNIELWRNVVGPLAIHRASRKPASSRMGTCGLLIEGPST